MDFDPDSQSIPRLVVRPGLGWKRRKLQQYSRGSFSAVIVHTTGLGVVRKSERWGVDPFAAAIRVYSTQMDAGGHYLVGQMGQVAQLVPESVVAWHVGASGSAAYQRAGWYDGSQYEWWRRRWPQYQSPMELAHGNLWARGPSTGKPSCNANTVGIEVVPPPDNGPWSLQCWTRLGALVMDICERRGITASLETVLTHSDAHPRKRTSRGRPWDPGPVQWSYQRFAAAVGLPVVCGPDGSAAVV